jgi:DNA-binding protein HU-beta
MTKTEVVRRVARHTRLPQQTVNDVLTASHRLIEETLRSGESVVFPGFGSFYTSKRQAGSVTHIRTGERVAVPERTVAGFRVGDVLKRAVNGQRRDAGRKQAKAA